MLIYYVGFTFLNQLPCGLIETNSLLNENAVVPMFPAYEPSFLWHYC